MKKYLMSGVAALALCAAFTSCSKNEELFDQGAINQNTADQVVEKYNQAFLKYVGGTIDPEQTWGFGGYSAGTRATGKFADYKGAEPNGHLWTSYGFKAPDALTPGQKLRVQYYFQSVQITNPNQPNNGVKDFFMQQVYDGATDPITNYKQGNYSSEVYHDAVGNTIQSGEQMNYLKAGSDHEHVNNYNNADYPNPIPNVANWNQTVLDDPAQEHPDQIMLMLNTKTDCFGYLNSSNSTYYDDQWTLVSAATIDAFCDNADNGYADFLVAHPSVTDAKVDDDWHRGFIGFDFKLLPDQGVFLNKTAKYSDDGGWLSELDNTANQTKFKLYYDGANFVPFTDYNADIKINNAAIPVLDAELNFYGGNMIGVGGQENLNDFPTEADYVEGGANDGSLYLKKIPGYQSDKRALNLKFIERMLNDDYYPVDTKNLRLWVKVSDLTDGFYSDWIVSFMPADYNPPVDPDDVCIIAEDLNAADPSDFDFNDVVFTVHYTSTSAAEIEVYAAGATQLIKIGTSESSAQEVHKLFADANNDQSLAEPDPTTGLYKMINTGEKADVNGLIHPKFNLAVDKSKRGNDVEIWINKFEKVSEGVYVDKDNWIKLTATKGTPAAKLCVGADFATGYKYCKERQDIRSTYPKFYDWVSKNPTLIWWY